VACIVWVLPIGDVPITCAVVVWFDLCVLGDVCVTCVYFEFVPIVVDKLDWIICFGPGVWNVISFA